MGESIAEATLVKWLKEVGDKIETDESVVEIATDKVDSDIPSEVKGVLKEKKFLENDIIKVGEIIGIIETENDDINEQSGGLYIISDLAHYVTPNETFTKLNLIRDSFGIKPKND